MHHVRIYTARYCRYIDKLVDENTDDSLCSSHPLRPHEWLEWWNLRIALTKMMKWTDLRCYNPLSIKV